MSTATIESKAGRTCEMCVMDHTGDTKIIWNPSNADEVAAAKATFDSLRKKGYVAYLVQPGGDKGIAVVEFNPSAEKLILTPPLIGG